MSKNFSKSIIIELIILFVFIIFLILLPFLINDDSDSDFEEVKDFGENSNELLKYKFDIMVREIGEFFENKYIYEINNEYLSILIVDNKISNRDNTLAQELIALYENNYINESKEFAASLIEDFLLYYDGEDVGVWRNNLFYFEGENINFTLYNKSNLLINIDNATVIGNYSFYVEPYEEQIYYITLKNDSVNEVRINLITKKGEEDLEKYIDSNTQRHLVEIKDLKSEYILSNREYQFNLYMWK